MFLRLSSLLIMAAAGKVAENRCVQTFSDFKTYLIEDSWSEAIWESDFTVNDTLPITFESQHEDVNWKSLFSKAAKACREWIQLKNNTDTTETDQNDHGFWTNLIDSEVNIKKLIALCYHFTEKGQKLSSNPEEKEIALWAADVYCALLSIPGCNAFSIFHPLMFQKCLDVCKMAVDVNGMILKRKRTKEKQNPKPPAKRRRKRNTQEVEEGDEPEDGRLSRIFDDDSDGEEIQMDSQELKHISKTFETVISHIIETLKIFSLKQCEDSLLHSIQRMSDLTRLETGTNKNSTSVQLGYDALTTLCAPLHGNVDKIHIQVMKQMMTNILGRNVNVKDHATDFVIDLLESLGADAEKGTKTLIQQLCVRVGDRAEYRASIGNAVAMIVTQLSGSMSGEIFKWFGRILLNQKVNIRLFTVELLSLFLDEGNKKKHNFSFADRKSVDQKSLLKAIVGKFADKASSVRAKVLQILSHCATSNDLQLRRCFLELFNEGGTESDKENDEEAMEEEDDDDDDSDDSFVIGGCKEDFMTRLHKRFDDDKVHVRKSALQVLENLIKLNKEFLTVKNVDQLEMKCLDPALLVRKQMICSITSLLDTYPESSLLQEIWVKGVLPCMVDREQTVQEKCMELMETIILQNIVPFERSTTEAHQMVWKILKLIADKGSERYLRRACHSWAKTGKIRSNLVTILQTHIPTDNGSAVWLLLSEVAPSIAIKNVSVVAEHWFQRTEQSSPVDLQRILTIIGHCAHNLPEEEAIQLKKELEAILEQFSYPTVLISAALITTGKLMKSLADNDDEAKKMMTAYCINLLKKCDEFLSDAILQQATSPITQETEDKIICYLYTLGETATHSPNKIPKRIFLVVQSLITTPMITDRDSAAYDIPVSQPESQTQSQPQSQPIKQFNGSTMSVRVRAHAYVTLGKLCLQHEYLAKKCAPALARELEMSEEATIRNNIVIILSDLCVRYTALVDRYISNISTCLKDPSITVRRQTLMLLTNLLQEDYIKWKGTLFVRFISSLVDEDKNMRDLAEFSLIRVLIHRYPHMFYNHFVECIFYFHAYKDHATFSAIQQTDKEVELFALRGGGNNEEKRLKMYRFMLDNMTDEHRFQITAKIVQDILGGVVDGILPLNDHSKDIVRDGLKILACDEIKLSTLRSSPQDDLDEGDLAAAVVVTAKKTIISQVVKKNVIENIVPIVVSLKHKLEEKKSILLKDLMFFLKELMKDYKNEIKDILSADKALAKEIEFDLKRFENEQQQEERAKANKNKQNESVVNKSPFPTAKPFTPQGVLASVKGLIEKRNSARSSERTADSTPRSDPMDEMREIPDQALTEESPRSPVVRLTRLPANMSSSVVDLTSLSLMDEGEEGDNIQPNILRAISTPEKTINDVTFRNMEMTMAVPSPVVELERLPNGVLRKI